MGEERMKIERVETLHADGAWRNFDFVKVTADNGVVGWSEYNESFGGKGVTAMIESVAPLLVGQDPRRYEAISAWLYARGRTAQGGMTQQATAAIENALIDLKARALGVPVYELFGGPTRERIRLYWSHCGTYRVWGDKIGIPTVRTYDDLVKLGKEVAAAGYGALKTNVLLLGDGNPRVRNGGFGRGDGYPDLNPDRYVLDAVRAELSAFREGAGRGMDILVDLNWNFKPEGFLQVARAMEPYDLFWVEIDTRDPKALASIRNRTTIPVASCECLFGRRDYRPFFEQAAMDVAIIDVPWNGFAESVKIAAMAEAFDLNIAPHNFYGHLSTMMSAHLAAVVPNLRIMETDPDVVPWQDDLFTVKPQITDGHMLLPTGPGWGTEVDEAAVRAHPPKGDW
jgi:L-alanine-DL-glutamate epimerase-like enolase superfamily enzyme